MNTALRHRCLAVCGPGLEELCAAELVDLGVRIRRTLLGGVEFGATDRQLYAANLWTRTATRILVRVAAFTATTFEDFEREIDAVDWSRFIPPGATPSVRVSSTASRLYHTTAVAERVVDVVTGGQQRNEKGSLVVVRLIHDRVMVSVDSSGDALYQRGWRLATAKAPLRETLAAAMILASGWDRQSPLEDPMCGSGTIAIEAALLAAGRAPGEGRRFGFMDWPSFAPGTWASVTAAPHPTMTAPTHPAIVASDRDAGAVAAATANAARAGVADAIDLHRASLSDVPEQPPPGWLLTNPPYGKRVAGGGDLRDLYASLGALVSDRRRGWVAGLLVADDRLAGHTKLRLRKQFATDNGGIPVHFLVTTLAPPC